MIVNKKLWKRVAAFVMACTLVTGTAGTNTTSAARNEENIAVANWQEKISGKIAKEKDNIKNMGAKENTSELNKILKECEAVEYDNSSKKIKKGQILLVPSVSRDENTCMAIMPNGDLYCWGYNYYGQVGNGTTIDQLVPMKILENVDSVFFEGSHSAAIMENGDLYCWGYNENGEAGNGTTIDQLIPIKILENVDSVFFESSHSAAITENGDLYCWGYNKNGEAGNGTTDKQLTPMKVLENVVSVSLTDYNSAAITSNRELYCWGANRYGQVGNGTTTDQLLPTKVLENVTSVSFESSQSAAITENGDLYCWGHNGSGQVGNGTTELQLTPVKVLSDVNSVSIFNFSSFSSSYMYMMAAITGNGDLYCWGHNGSGQVGNGTTELQLTPVRVLENVRTVTATSYGGRGDGVGNLAATTTNGDLYCWGWNTSGQVGNGTTGTQLIPVKVLSDVSFVSLSASVSVVSGVQSYNYRTGNMAAITADGDLYCWGANRSGQVGNGTTSEAQCTPEKVLSNVNFVSVASCGDGSVSNRGFGNTVAITTNGDLYCWGVNGSGQIGNGTTNTQFTPEKILGNISSVSLFSSSSNFTFGAVTAVTTNGDLYCWGANRSGQVGSGTTINQLTPLKVLGSPNKNGCLQIPDSITVEKGKSKYIGGKILVDNLDLDQQKEINESLKVISANPSVATADRNPFDLIMNDDGRYTMQLSIGVTGVSRGETDIFISASDGSKVCCHVVVIKATETVEEPDDTGYSYCFGIAGELQDVNSANHTMKIDGVSYEASSDSIISDAKKILEQHDNKIVACQVRATDNQIVQVDDVKDIIGEPSVHIKPEVDNINYEDGKYSKKSFKIDLEMYCGVKEPYHFSEISDVMKKVDGLELTFSKLSLTTWYKDTGVYAFLLKDGLFEDQKTTIEKELNFKLKPGQTKKFSVTACVKEESFILEKVNADAKIQAKINDNKETEMTATVHLSNLDKAREAEQKKLAVSPKNAELKKANTVIDGLHAEYSEQALSECLTNTEVKAISTQVYNWLYTLNALNIIINDDDDSSVLKKLLKQYGLTKEDLQNKVLKKLGIDKNVIPWGRSYTGTLQFEAKDKNTGKNITIKFTADMNLYTLGGNDFVHSGWGTLKYKISTGGSGQGLITYVNMDVFVASLRKVVDSQAHNCFNKIYANGINEIFNDAVADSLVSSTFGTIVNEKYGSASEAVYTYMKYAFTGYTEEDAKKDIKDIVIILTKEKVNKYTNLYIDCPVDVTVYDGDGNICAEIKDDIVNEKYQNVAAYVKGEAKYLLLPDTDYTLCYSGSDTGTMDYTVTEYENGEAVRELIYNDVPLTIEKKYVNYLISGRHQGISLYNLNQVDGGVVEATSDIDKTKEQDISAKSITLNDKTLSLKKGESYILMETISPDDVSIRNLTWSSSNDDVLEVNGSGVLYAKADGEAVITVKINGRNLSDSCRVIVGEGNASSPAPDSTSTPVVTGQPDGIVPQPPVGPTDTIRPSYTNTPMPTAKPIGTVNPPYTNTPVPTAKPTSTTRPSYTNAPSPAGALTPKPTNEPIETPSSTLKPSDNPKPTTTSSPENNSNFVKKGSKVTDRKTKAVYKITGTGKSRTVEYTKSTKKSPISISVPASVKLKGNKYKVTSVGKNAFKNSKKLKTVKIGKNVKKIGKQAFAGCTKLTNVTLDRNVTTIGAQAFNKCTALTIITIPSHVTKIGDKAFYQCKNLRYILVKTNKLTAKNVGSNAFGKGAAKLRVKTDKNKWRLYAQIFMAKGMSKKALFIIDPVKLVI